MSGFFVTFESIDGVGKSTQVRLLADALRSQGHRVHETKEPGDRHTGSCLGAAVRHVLFTEQGTKHLQPGVADLLFLADHIQNSGDVADRLRQGEVVISDRYADSNLAYAAAPSKRAPQWVERYFQERYGTRPDLILLLIAVGPKQDASDVQWALARAQARRGEQAGKQDGKAWNDAQEQWTIQQAYMHQLGSDPRAVFVPVREEENIGDVHRRVLSLLRWHSRSRTLFSPE